MKTKPILLKLAFLATSLASCRGNDSPQATTSSGDQPVTAATTSGSSSTSSSSQSSKQDFTDIVFNDAEFDYDGQAHSIFVSGAPDFATVTYTNNNKTEVGTYTVTARIEAVNYNTLVKTASLRIKGQIISGVTFESKTFTYDGNAHSLEANNVPSGVNVIYTNNGKTNAGAYTVSANLTGTGLEPLMLTATLTINPVELENSGIFNSAVFIYDGENHNVEVKYAPNSTTISYRCLNASGTNTFKNPGFYEIEAIVKLDNNHLSKKYASLVITSEATAATDSTKTPLTINASLKWDELYSALANNNFTLKYLSGSYDVEAIDDPMPDNLLSDSYIGHTSGQLFASDGKEAFQHSYSLNSSSPSHYYDYYKELGNDIIHLDSNTGHIVKFPKAAFHGTVTKNVASDAFVALTKGEHGEFYDGIDRDDNYSDVGTAYIENGVFTVLMQHSRSISSGYRYFYRIYKFYNIGNTSVSIPSNYFPSSSYVESKMGIDDFYLDGVMYSNVYYGTASSIRIYYGAQLYVDYHHAIFLEKGTHTALPLIYSRVVEAIVYTDANHAYNTDQSGYNFKLYINSSGQYQGEYSSQGALSKLDITEFISRGGTVQYYDDWHI